VQEEEVKEAEERVKVAKEGVVEEQEEEEEQQQQAVVIVVVGRAEEDTWRLIIGFTRRMCVRRASTSSRTRLRFGSVSLPPFLWRSLCVRFCSFLESCIAVRVCLLGAYVSFTPFGGGALCVRFCSFLESTSSHTRLPFGSVHFFFPFVVIFGVSEHECVFSCVCIIMDVYYV
jgi:hypothetical protein